MLDLSKIRTKPGIPTPPPPAGTRQIKVHPAILPRGWNRALKFEVDYSSPPKGGQVGMVELENSRSLFGRLIYGPHDQVIAVQPLRRNLPPFFFMRRSVVAMAKVIGVTIPLNSPRGLEQRVVREIRIPNDHTRFKPVIAEVIELNRRYKAETKAAAQPRTESTLTLQGNAETGSRELAAVA